ncbi:hypothetical protein Tco_1090281 [Tanacetum coccineum]|uniref:Uncharacterized protein n=1 Tax=Tanacetum coccineum TaxID=301880 RepID=A0ABQ5I5U1_9ASTR
MLGRVERPGGRGALEVLGKHCGGIRRLAFCRVGVGQSLGWAAWSGYQGLRDVWWVSEKGVMGEVMRVVVLGREKRGAEMGPRIRMDVCRGRGVELRRGGHVVGWREWGEEWVGARLLGAPYGGGPSGGYVGAGRSVKGGVRGGGALEYW